MLLGGDDLTEGEEGDPLATPKKLKLEKEKKENWRGVNEKFLKGLITR